MAENDGGGNDNSVKGGSEMFDGGAAGGDLTGKIDFFGIKDIKKRITSSEGDDDYFGEDDSDSEDEEAEAEEDSSGAEDDEEEEGEEDEPERKRKKVAAKDGDKDISLHADLVVPTTVNGKQKNPTLQELRDTYASKSSIADDRTKAKEEREAVVKEKLAAQRFLEQKNTDIAKREVTLNRVAEAAKKHDFEGVLIEAALLAGVDPSDVWDKMDDVLGSYYSGDEKQQGFTQLTPAERRALQLNRRVHFSRVIDNRRNETAQHERSVAQYEAQRTSILSQAGVSEEEVHSAWDGLVALAREGKLSPQEQQRIAAMPPMEQWQYAAAQAIRVRTRSRLNGVLEKHHADLKPKAEQIISRIEELMGPKFINKATDEDIAELVRRVYKKGKETKKVSGREGSATTPRVKKGSLREKVSPRADGAATDDDDEDDPYSQERGKPTSEVWGAAFRKFS